MAALYMIIDQAKMEVLQLGEVNTICAKQFLENPGVEIYTAPVSLGASYTCFSMTQLKQLAVGLGIQEDLQYGALIQAIRNALVEKYKTIKPTLKSEFEYELLIKKAMKADPEKFEKYLPADPPEPKVIPRATKTVSVGNLPAKPKGGTTKRVWEIADSLKEQNPGLDIKSLRALIIEKCEAEGINKATAGTQYSKWKKDQGE